MRAVYKTTAIAAALGIGGNRFLWSPGNVIAVTVGTAGYCISGYKTSATEATSATKSMLYKSDDGGIQAAVGAC